MAATSPPMAATRIVSGIIMVMSPPSTPATIPAAPAKAPTRTVPAVPTETIVRISPTPSIGTIAPVPPQTIGESGKSICIETIGVYVPIPRIQAIDNVPVEWAAYTDSITGITETNNTRSIFIIIFRTTETIYPFTVQVRLVFLIYIQSIVL